MEEWVFASGTRFEDCFQQQLLMEMHAKEVLRVVKDQLWKIKQDPRAGEIRIVDGEEVRVVKTGHFTLDGVTVEPLLLAYVLDYRQYLIHMLHICRAGASEPVERTLRRALGKVPQVRNH
jgi:hypothetical protein